MIRHLRQEKNILKRKWIRNLMLLSPLKNHAEEKKFKDVDSKTE